MNIIDEISFASVGGMTAGGGKTSREWEELLDSFYESDKVSSDIVITMSESLIKKQEEYIYKLIDRLESEHKEFKDRLQGKFK